MNKQLIDGRYVIDLDQSQAGGMGRVYKASDSTTNKVCALKTLSTLTNDVPINKLAMKRELEALQSLSHNNIVPLVGYGETESLGNYIVIDWMQADLRTRCKNSPYSDWYNFWLSVGSPILDALSYIFQKRISHRDVKPANIMFDDSGVPKLIDFGISGAIRKANIDTTLSHLGSGIYSPPESSCQGPMRDVFGFAASSVYALSGNEISTYDQLMQSLDEIAADQDIREILSNCLSLDPESRPANPAALLAQISRAPSIKAMESKSASRKSSIYITFPFQTVQFIQKYIPYSTPKSIVESLREGLYAQHIKSSNATSDKLKLVTAEFTIIVDQDSKNPTALYAINVQETRPNFWSIVQEHWLRIEYDFQELAKTGKEDESIIAIAELYRILEERASARGVTAGQSIFDVWMAVLRGRAEHYGNKYPALSISSIQANGARIIVSLFSEIESEIVGLNYFVESASGRVAGGVVESTQGDSITLYCEHAFDPSAVKLSTRLRFNESGTQKALRNQESALNNFRSGEIPNPRLANYIIDPRSASPPSPVEYTPILDIDESKQNSVRFAMGSDGVFVVVGPPGTGKTEFIAELILQEVRRNPSIRILLSAQTHMAVDNALARLTTADPKISCIRLGRMSDRMSREATSFLLENVAPTWRANVSTRSKNALTAYALRHGVDIDVLVAHKVARQAHEARIEFSKYEERLESYRMQRSSLSEGTDARSDEIDDEKDKLDELLLRMQEDCDTRAKNVKDAENAVWASGESAVAVLDQLSSPASAGADFPTMSPHIDNVLSISAAWLQRLALAHEFFHAILVEAQVVAGTCLGFVGVPGTADIVYDLAIIEEASRALPQEVLVPASRAKRVVLVGDSKQLPPFLESELLKQEWLEANDLEKADVKETLFERFEKLLPEACISRLTHQYRMHPAIGNLVAENFYPKELHNADGSGGKALTLSALGFDANVIAVTTSNMSTHGDDERGSGFDNACEVDLVKKILLDILKRARRARKKITVAVLSAYVAQRKALELALAGYRAVNPEAVVHINTVHTFQGRQADICIYSCVRSDKSGDLGFTSDSRLLNVALSRGRGGLIIVGDITFLSSEKSSAIYRDVFRYINASRGSCKIEDGRHV